MMLFENGIAKAFEEGAKKLFNAETGKDQISVQNTRKEFEGDYTINIFPFLQKFRETPEKAADKMGRFLCENTAFISKYNVIKGFLNLTVSDEAWLENFTKHSEDNRPKKEGNGQIMIEFSSPNTNKPLHLGHIRNNLLGESLARIIERSGKKVIKVNLVNDRGIHICKSMLAWQKFGNGATPESTGMKGDKLVGEFYVKFDREYKKEVELLIAKGMTKEAAAEEASLMLEAKEMLRKWESGDKEVTGIWKMMNNWVYDGFETTYKKLGITFDKTYYESDTYKLGKKIVQEGLNKAVFHKKEDGSVWIDLTSDGLDEKLLLRADGTSVYMTQDLGTAHQRFSETDIDTHIYVVGNEQNYHFQVLKLVLSKLGYEWASRIFHLSYGMVELPEGKMKSREGTVVDADDLIASMLADSKELSDELGKLDEVSDSGKEEICRIIAMGALKFFILKVDPKKNMVFDPKESIDFNGKTGPFIQYTYARIRSILRKTDETVNYSGHFFVPDPREKQLMKHLYNYPAVLKEAAEKYTPSQIANFVYDLAKDYNQFYHECPVLKEQDYLLRQFRLELSGRVASVIRETMGLLGIEVPDRM